jgi:hypothetical protein
MTNVLIVVREIGRLKPDFSLDFDLPEVPKPGAYISIYRGNPPETHSEDLLVEKVWWQLNHPETGGFGRTPPLVGKAASIIVECTQAIGPTSNDRWRDTLEARRAQGVDVPEFEIARFSVRQDQLKDIEEGKA